MMTDFTTMAVPFTDKTGVNQLNHARRAASEGEGSRWDAKNRRNKTDPNRKRHGPVEGLGSRPSQIESSTPLAPIEAVEATTAEKVRTTAIVESESPADC